MLADRVDALEHASVDDPRDAGRQPARIRALGLDALADERPQTGSGAMDGVALGHGKSVEARSKLAAAGTGRRLHTPKR